MKYPAGEIVWVGYYNGSGDLRYIITSKPTMEWYFLYEVVEDGFKKLGRDKEPPALVRKYGVMEGIR